MDIFAAFNGINNKMRVSLNGRDCFLRVLSAAELLLARAESGAGEVSALVSNASLLSLALVDRKDARIFESGAELLCALPAFTVASLTSRYAELESRSNPSCAKINEAAMDEVKKNCSKTRTSGLNGVFSKTWELCRRVMPRKK